MGILVDLNRKNKPCEFTDSGPIYEIPNHVCLPRTDGLSEQRLVRKIVRFKTHASVLVTCGFIHVKPFAAKLLGASFDILTESLLDYEWYRADRDIKRGDGERYLNRIFSSAFGGVSLRG